MNYQAYLTSKNSKTRLLRKSTRNTTFQYNRTLRAKAQKAARLARKEALA